MASELAEVGFALLVVAGVMVAALVVSRVGRRQREDREQVKLEAAWKRAKEQR